MGTTPEKEKIVLFVIDADTTELVTTKTTYDFSTPLFLCEIFEKLNNKYVDKIECNEFFNYEDPRGAWELLTEFFDKTDYLKNKNPEGVPLHKYFEIYRSMYGISLDFKMGEILEEDKTHPTWARVFERELDEFRIFDKKSIENSSYNPNVFQYYSCARMIDFVFGLIHYFIFNENKIVRCKHCGKLFATPKEKEMYCIRNSPYNGYEEYTCKAAVKAVKDSLEKRRKSEYERLRQRANEFGTQSKHYELFNSFIAKCDEFKSSIKKGASIELLKRYENFLYDSDGLRPKYERFKNW